VVVPHSIAPRCSARQIIHFPLNQQCQFLIRHSYTHKSKYGNCSDCRNAGKLAAVKVVYPRNLKLRTSICLFEYKPLARYVFLQCSSGLVYTGSVSFDNGREETQHAVRAGMLIKRKPVSFTFDGTVVQCCSFLNSVWTFWCISATVNGHWKVTYTEIKSGFLFCLNTNRWRCAQVVETKLQTFLALPVDWGK
jgi:hypothetical protein